MVKTLLKQIGEYKRDTIIYGRLEATDEECIAAAKLANADSFIRRLSDGYQTPHRRWGQSEPGPAAALLAIARAAVADPPVLILDEATSSIDTRTEQLVQEGMDRLMKGRTTFASPTGSPSRSELSDCIMFWSRAVSTSRGTTC